MIKVIKREKLMKKFPNSGLNNVNNKKYTIKFI